jgi:hypothetical protein
VHEFHRPRVVLHGGYGQRLRCLADDPLARLDPQVQLERTIHAVHAFVVPAELLDVSQVQNAQPETPPTYPRFERREFGEDPYFLFPHGATGPTGCPAHQRLSYAGSDSVGVRLEVLDERGTTPQVRARCTVRFVELEGTPVVGTLPDGRAMWALRAVRENNTRQATLQIILTRAAVHTEHVANSRGSGF